MGEEIKKIAEILQNGGIILYPTDTIWGLGCDPTNNEAVEKLNGLKKRDKKQSFLILADSISMVERYVEEIPNIAYDLIDVSDKPITLVYPKAKNLAPNVAAEDGSIGIRITEDDFCKRLIQKFKKPIVSTSANMHNTPFPKSFVDISDEVKKIVDYIVDWKQEDKTLTEPSSIIKIGTDGEVKVIRD